MVKITSVKPKKRNYTLREIYDKRKCVLVKRATGGLGDILMHRMIFEDFKLLIPDLEITFACPVIYHEAVIDHPYIDNIVDAKTVKEDDFVLYYNTTSICSRYELRVAPYVDKHRSDIWAEHCGVPLTRHDMHIRLSKEERQWARNKLSEMNPESKPTVLLSPISAMMGKNLEVGQGQPVIDELKKRGYYVFITHTADVPQFDAPCLNGISIRQWMSIIKEVNFVISVDTSTYHCAGGLGKPVVAVFGWADGKVYGKYYPGQELVQKHRDYTPDWTCGPCYNFGDCVKLPGPEIRKPCITEITSEDILDGFDRLVNRYT
jgi:ADP-heptose:LPS heptosyltransferase